MSTKEDLIQSLVENGYLKTPHIIEAFRAIDRADFVLPEHKAEAYENRPLPIGEGQTISQPLTVAFLLELLQPQPGDKILDVGSGSGWTPSLLAHIVSQNNRRGIVYAIERLPQVWRFGAEHIKRYGFIEKEIVKTYCQDGTVGLLDASPFDKILSGAAAYETIPQAWKDQLKVGGVIVSPVGNSVRLYRKRGKHLWEEEEFPGFAFVPLIEDKKERPNARPWKKFTVFSALLLSVLSLLSFFEIYRPHAAYAGVKKVEVTSGLGSRKIGELLKQEGVIRSKWMFVTYVSLRGEASSLKPGTYVFAQNTIPEIARDLVAGRTNERVVTIPEGWEIFDIAAYLEEQRIGSKRDFLFLTTGAGSKKFNPQFSFLNEQPATVGLEGYLFPDTYRVYADASSEDVVVKMLENFGRKTAEFDKEIEKQGRNLFEVITMASLIEDEVRSDEDRATVSGVLWKRLKAGIPLQVDATVRYAKRLRGDEIPSSGKISLADTRIDSPYNTYRYRGLPRGPISNPGISAIQAALHPKESPYLYYLSAKDGTTIFSRTLEEHNAAKEKYLSR